MDCSYLFDFSSAKFTVSNGSFQHVDLLPFVRELPDKFGYLKLLLTHSRASIASVAAASFAERINSSAGVISTKGNVCLAFDEISNLVPLRMNRNFIARLKAKYAAQHIFAVEAEME